LNITHILTVLHFDPERPKDDRRIRKHVYAYDFNTADLLGEFESCYQFIDKAVRNNENVLIHCHAGIRKRKEISLYFSN
jgi:protein-tyrosine phosphatase